MGLLTCLSPGEVPVYETFVVPRYISMFGAAALDMIVPCEGAVIANVGRRSGFPDQVIGDALPSPTLIGFDGSQAALELARTKATLIHNAALDYREADGFPLPVAEQSFSHAIAIHPLIEPSHRPDVISELFRLLAPGGQALFATPLRGSFQEVADLLKEYALKHEATDVAKALEANVTTRPTVENLSEAMEDAGFADVDVDMRLVTLTFKSGRDFFEDPIARLIIVPDLQMTLGIGELAAPLAYVREAIDRYWSEADFALSVNVGCASGRRSQG